MSNNTNGLFDHFYHDLWKTKVYLISPNTKECHIVYNDIYTHFVDSVIFNILQGLRYIKLLFLFSKF